MLTAHVFFLFLSGFGLFSLLWTVMGFFLPSCRDGWILCTKAGFVPVYLWLRGFGIVNCPLILIDGNMSDEQRRAFTAKDIEVHSPETISARLGKDIT